MFGDNQIAIAISKDDRYEAFLKGEDGLIEENDEEDEENDPVADMVKNLEHTKQ